MDRYDKDVNRVTQVKTDIKYDEYRLTCCVINGYLYICRSGQHCIYKVNMSTGCTIQTYGSKGRVSAGELWGPYICCSDDKMILITDCINHRLQLLDVNTNSWSVLNVDGIKQPTAAVVSCDGQIYVGGGYPYTLYIIK